MVDKNILDTIIKDSKELLTKITSKEVYEEFVGSLSKGVGNLTRLIQKSFNAYKETLRELQNSESLPEEKVINKASRLKSANSLLGAFLSVKKSSSNDLELK